MARRNGIMNKFSSNMKTLFSGETLKGSAYIAAGSVLTPIASAIITGTVNKVAKVLPEEGALAKGVDLLSGAVLATAVGMVLPDPRAGQYILYGAAAGAINDLASETVLPAVGLSDYLTMDEIGMSDYLTMDQVGMSDYATVEDVETAPVAGTVGEEF